MHKRSLRVLLVAKILKQAGFKTHINKDFIKARMKAEEAETIQECLHVVGTMLGMTRFLDLSLENESEVDSHVKKFYEQTELPQTIAKTP